VQWPPEPWFLGSETSSRGNRKVIRHDTRQQELDAKISKALVAISRGEDEITTTLEPVFALAKAHDSEQLRSAELRKTLGNPPGKRNDPVGDQLSWVQLLDALKKGDRLWIASADSDYLVTFEKDHILNPMLLREVKERIGDPDNISCFDTLSNALKDFLKKTGKQREKSTEDALTEAAKAERHAPSQRRGGVLGLLTVQGGKGVISSESASYIPGLLSSSWGSGSRSAPVSWSSGILAVPSPSGLPVIAPGLPDGQYILKPKCPACTVGAMEKITEEDPEGCGSRIIDRCSVCGFSRPSEATTDFGVWNAP
jgi:hypothetical protein